MHAHTDTHMSTVSHGCLWLWCTSVSREAVMSWFHCGIWLESHLYNCVPCVIDHCMVDWELSFTGTGLRASNSDVILTSGIPEFPLCRYTARNHALEVGEQKTMRRTVLLQDLHILLTGGYLDCNCWMTMWISVRQFKFLTAFLFSGKSGNSYTVKTDWLF